jgi:hypothetical protein
MPRGQLQHSNVQNARDRLAAPREKKPPTKAAQIRALWPDINAALGAGHSLKSVCECLEADGINITVPALGSYITRMRRKSLKLAAPTPTAAIESATRQSYPGELAETADPKRKFDPLANIRERQGKHSGFDYRPELADPNELI